MNTIVTIIELVELAALIALVIYLIRLTRDNNELRDKLNKSELIDRNLDEVNEFNGAMVADPERYAGLMVGNTWAWPTPARPHW